MPGGAFICGINMPIMPAAGLLVCDAFFYACNVASCAKYKLIIVERGAYNPFGMAPAVGNACD